MLFSELSCYLEKLEATSSRIEITEILAELFKKTSASEIDKVCYLVLGYLAPSYRNIVFSIAEKTMIRILSQAYGLEEMEVLAVYKELGDLGEVAFKLAGMQKNSHRRELSVNEVYERLKEVALEKGEESQERKVDKMAAFLKEMDPLSAKFVSRIPIGRLRLGFLDKTILDALSWFETGGKGKKVGLERAYAVLPDVGLLAKQVKIYGIDKTVADIKPVVGVPLLPMLAARLKSPSEMIEKMGEVAVEPKYDGLRIQIHFKRGGFDDGSEVKAFTRNLNEASWMFPELVDIGRFLKADEVVLDSEAVGVDEKRKTLANFQTTMTRRRKYDIENISKKVKIRFCIFDCMYMDGKSLVDKSYLERRAVLSKILVESPSFENVLYEVTKDPGKINALMLKNIKEGKEGIIVKRVDSGYVAGRTGWRWVKMKEEEGSKAKLADTIDAVVMGFYKGRGKRADFGLGGFLVGILDGEKIVTLTKIGTGLTDEQFRQLKGRLSGLGVVEKPRAYARVDKSLIPDVWVLPEVVVEIAADEITQSPIHSSGYALRFPRLVRFREDKSLGDITTLSEVKKLFRLQKS